MISYIKQKLIANPDQISMKSNFMWNMLGSLLFAASTIVLTIVTTRVVGDSLGGDFAIALATGQLMASIGYYEVRTIQVTDIHNKYEFDAYFYHRIGTSICMIICSILFILFKGYDISKMMLVLLLCFWKLSDTFADVYEGLFQKEGRLDIAGKSLSIRTLLGTLTFIIVLLITKNVYIASLSTIIVAIVCIFFLNIQLRTSFYKERLHFQWNKVKYLFIDCFPLFAGVFMYSYVSNAARYAIDNSLSSNFITYFTAIFLPVSVINLVSGFIFKPLLTSLADIWTNQSIKAFLKHILIFLIVIVIITASALIGGYFLGIPILSILYGIDLNTYRNELLILLLGGGFSAFSTIEYYCLAVMRRQNLVFVGYGLTFIISLIIPNLLIQNYQITGAAWCYTILMFLLAFIFALEILYGIYKRKNT